MAAKLDQSQKDLIKDRNFMRRVAHGYEMQIAPGVWVQGAFLAQGQDRFIVDAGRLDAGIVAALGSLTSQDDANFAAAALLRLKTAAVEVGGAQLRQALAGSPYALTLLAALDADVTDAAFLMGSSGADRLAGGDGRDTLAGHRGNDRLEGGAGSDTYLFSAGDGHDTIADTAGAGDTIRFGAGITPAMLGFKRVGQDLVLSFEGSSDQITIAGWGTDSANHIERFEFADGTVWDAEMLARLVRATAPVGTAGDDVLQGWDAIGEVLRGGAGDDLLRGGGGDDLLLGGSGNDTLDGAAGADDLIGALGADTYLFRRGDGQDTIYDFGFDRTGPDSSLDTIRFGDGISAGDIVLRREDDGLVFAIAGTDDRITVDGWGRHALHRIERVEFADGTVWETADLQALTAGLPLSTGATDGDDQIQGWSGFDETLQGLGGDDDIAGGDGDDTLEGGTGNDRLYGGAGLDTYRFARGDGIDTIEDYDYQGKYGTIVFGAGIAESDIVMSRSGYDLVIRIKDSSDQITISGWVQNPTNGVGRLEFADGSAWDEARLRAEIAMLPIVGTDGADYLHGNDGDNTLIGGAGNDTLYGGAGNDVYQFARGDGHDTIAEYDYGYGANKDTIRFGPGITAADIAIARVGSGVVLSVMGSGDSVTIANWAYGSPYRIEQVEFADGTVWSSDDLGARVLALPYLGTDGDDYLTGDPEGNVLVGGRGNDRLQGGFGNDTYLFERGDGQDIIEEWGGAVDTLRFGAGIGAGDIVLVRSGSDLVLSLAGSEDRVTLRDWAYGGSSRVEQVAFADGTVWDAAALAARFALLPVLGTPGDDYLNGDDGANTLIGGAGNDALRGGAGTDTYVFERGDGQDSIEEYGYDADTIRFGAGIDAGDIVLSRSGNDLVFSVAGSDDRITVRNWAYGDYYRVEQVVFADGTAWDAAALASMVSAIPVIGTDGDDYLSGDSSANVFDGGAGNDTLQGGFGGDTYLFERGDGQDNIEEYGYDTDTIRFGAGIAAADIVVSREGADVVFAVAGSDDRVTVRNWRYGDWYRIEQVAFADGTVWDTAALAAMVAALPLVGTDGDDVLDGDDSGDTFDGGAGNDTLRGGYGGDTYLFERGDGQDSIEEGGYGDGNADTIRFGAGIGAGDIVLSRSGNDLVLSIAGSDDRITVRDWRYGDYHRIEQVAFADGTVWDAAALADMVAAIPVVGTDGDDVLAGDEYANTIDGGAGNDTLQGGSGGDTYLFERGDGQDSIEESGYDVDTIRFGAGIGAGDIVLSRSGGDLVLAIAGSADRITVRNWRYGDYYRIEEVAFADGTVWDTAALAAMVAALPFVGTDGNDFLSGDDGANTFDGGAGDDTLWGGWGGDTYLFERGDGQDSISESGYGYGDVDTLRFGAGITAADIVVSREGSSLVFAVAGTDDRVTVSNWRDGDWYRIEQVAFADGTVWDAAALAAMVAALPVLGTDGDDYLVGDEYANTVDGGAGNDTLRGGSGGDTYLFESGDGQDSIEESGYGYSDTDTIRFGAGIGAGDIVLSRSGNDLVLAVAGSDDRITVRNWRYGNAYRIEQVAFADGTVWDASALADMVAAIPLLGTDGDDVLVGDEYANTIDGGAGNDTLQGGSGDDTYLFERGDGQDSIEEGSYGDTDTLRFGAGIGAGDIVLSRSGGDLVFALAGSDDRVTVRNWRYGDWYRIEQVAFADGTVWDAAALAAMVAAIPINGTDHDDYLSGDDSDNTFNGGAGNDTMYGGYGSDTYLFELGDGQDSIYESGNGLDSIRFGAGIAAADVVVSREGNDLVFAVAGTDDRVTVRNWRYGDYYRIEQVAFADGTVWDAAALQTLAALPITGTDGDDILVGDSDDNLFDGGAGNDTLQGGFGNDIYVFERGDGQDSIEEGGYGYGYGDAGADTLRFGAGIGAGDVVLSRSGNDLVFALAGSDDRVTVRNWRYGESYRIEQVAFADGTVWDAAALAAVVADLPITGTAGDDYLSGDEGANILDGGAGNDSLQGGYGADTYLFDLGGGQDSISDGGNDLDTIRFGAGITAADIVVSREGTDLVLAVAGTDDRITVRGWGYGDWYRIEQVAFADGTVWDAAALKALASPPLVGTDGDDYMVGDSDDNLFDGGAGNDTMQGDFGADTYLFELGDGQDHIHEAGYDSDTIRFGAGIAATDIVVSREGGNLVFAVAGTEDRITVTDWSYGAYYRIERIEFADGTAWDSGQIDSMVAGLPYIGTAGDDYLYGDEGDNVLVGGAGNDWLNGGAGGDTYLFGRGDGQDTLFDAGYDPSQPDVIRFGEGILEADISVSRWGSSLVFSINDSDDRIEVLSWQYGDAYRVERIEFADGTTWDAAAIEARIVPTRVVGSAGDDYLVGYGESNVFVGGAGNDVLEGNEGDDTYVYAPGDGNDTILDVDFAAGNVDTLRFGAGIATGDVALSRSGSNLVLTVGPTGETITVAMFGEGEAFAIERVEFDDGTTWSGPDLVQGLAAEPIAGTEQDDYLAGWDGVDDTLLGAAGTDIVYGKAGADTLDGGAGNDFLDGGSGGDVVLGGEGSDLLAGGTGNDTIETGEGSDIILFNRGDGQDTVRAGGTADDTVSLGGGIGHGDLLFSKSGDNLVLSAGGGEQITFQDWYAQAGMRSIANLQLVTEGGGIDAGSGGEPGPRIEQFDFGALVARFDEARLADPALGAWALSSSMLEFYLHGGSDAALGGDMSVQYGITGDLSAYPAYSAQALLASPEFGKTRQPV